LTAQYQCIKED